LKISEDNLEQPTNDRNDQIPIRNPNNETVRGTTQSEILKGKMTEINPQVSENDGIDKKEKREGLYFVHLLLDSKIKNLELEDLEAVITFSISFIRMRGRSQRDAQKMTIFSFKKWNFIQFW
jgi:hypothetical protein